MTFELSFHFTETIFGMGNPYMNKNAEFLKLDTCDFMNDKVTHTVHTAESLGIRKYEPASMRNT